MQAVKKNQLIHIILNILSSILLFIAIILLLAQTIINIKFNYSSNKEILSEKLVYEQFSHDVYSNINSKILYDFSINSFDKDCPEDKEPIFFSVKLDSYYDCDGDIVDVNKKNVDKNKCIYYNKYNGQISQIVNGYKICAKKYYYDYQYLLYLSEKNKIGKNECIYLDSYKHCIKREEIGYNNAEGLNLQNELITLNYSSVIIKNIFSEITPNYFEYKTTIKESILNNKKSLSNDEEKELDEFKELNIKTISDVFFEDLDNNYKGENIYYTNQKSFNGNFIINENKEPIFENYKNKDYIKEKNINWYTRNYIGFKNFEELSKFKENFDENDITNNYLYKLSQETLFPNIESIFIIIIFLGILLPSIIIQIKTFCNNKTVKVKEYLISDFLLQLLTLVFFIIYLFIYLFKYIYKYKKIEIDMEIYYQKVLEKYNSRRSQELLFDAIIILVVILVLVIINYLIMLCIYNTNGENFYSGNSIICTLKNLENNESHQFKFYLNRKFLDEMNRFKQKFFKNYDIDECKFKKIEKGDEKEIKIDENKIIREIGLENNSIIEVHCESR